MASAERAEEQETAASYESGAAVREAHFGKAAEARRLAAAALGLSTGKDVQCGAALALALAGDAARAQALTDDLAKRFPEDTALRYHCLPDLHAQLALDRNDASKAIQARQAGAPFELGAMGDANTLHPIYIRGAAYLARHQGSEALAEFQKILNDRGVVLNEPTGALAHVGLARAYALQGDTAKARVYSRHIHRLGAFVHPENVASIRVLEKLGFHAERRDTVMGMESIVFSLDANSSGASDCASLS